MATAPQSTGADARTALGRGEQEADIWAMARMWSGVEPQQPPIMLTMCSRANTRLSRAMSSGVSS